MNASIRDLTREPLWFIAAERRGTVEDFLYDVDIDGSSLLHLAVNSGVLGVSMHHVISSVELLTDLYIPIKKKQHKNAK